MVSGALLATLTDHVHTCTWLLRCFLCACTGEMTSTREFKLLKLQASSLREEHSKVGRHDYRNIITDLPDLFFSSENFA